MDYSYSDIQKLKKEFGNLKDIPVKYEREILIALSHFPELKKEDINFQLALHSSVPYGTKPSFASCFIPKNKRTYTITILEAAESPTKEALFRNLTENMRIAVIAHELTHVKQYSKCNPVSLLKTFILYMTPKYKRKIERNADIGAIEHGFGNELLEHALYIRSIPGYLKVRPEINKDYLLPLEIKRYMDLLPRSFVA